MPAIVKAALASLFFASFAWSQVGTPEAPKPIVREHAQQIKLSSSSTPCERACAAIAEEIPHAFYLKNEGEVVLWDAKQREITPACRIEPSIPEEVSIVLKAATKEQCHFAIRGGGHSRIAGSSNAEDGITIDLKKFNQIEIAKDKKTVKIGGGNVWLGDVYKSLEAHDLAVIGGRVSDVGVGGLILGGGISFLSNRYGWAADSVAAFEVVLPDASIKTVTHKSDPDLFWALRGGGNNFGVVTAFHSELINRKPEVWRGTRTYTLDKIDELLEAQYKFITEMQAKDPDAVAFFPFIYHAAYDLMMAAAFMFHSTHTDNSTWPTAFEAFEKIEGIPDTTEVVVKPMSDLTDDIMKYNPYGMRTIYKAITYRSSPEVDKKIVTAFFEEVEKVKKLEGIVPSLVIHPTPPGHTKPMGKNGGNPLGLAGEGPLSITQISWTWKNKEDDALNFEIAKILFDKAAKIAEDAGKLVPYIYQNYAWQDQDVFAGYGEENLARLQAIQKKIDPDGVFAGGEGLSRGYFKVNTKSSANDKEATASKRDEL